MRNAPICLILAVLACGWAAAQSLPNKPYAQAKDIAYGEAKGQTLYLDVFTPTGENRHAYLQPTDHGQGLALINVISGGWNSRRARQEEHEKAAVFDILCARGYTVFAIRPGSLPDFTGLEMVENLQRGIRWVKAHAAEYGIDPDRIGMMGASAGAHLASLAVAYAEPGQPDHPDPLLRHDTRVQALAAFFPPTDFLDWNGGIGPYEREPYLLFPDGVEGKSIDDIREVAVRLSPARQVKPGLPPIFLCHGEDDPVVPVQQAHIFEKALLEHGNRVDKIIKRGGGHFWITIPEEIIRAGQFFDHHLAGAELAKR